jgi:hypothetical protein
VISDIPYDSPPTVASHRTARLLGALAALAGLIAWFAFSRQDLILSHYDARAHLVVARRVFDSITPNWQQIGAVWLPLPHLIQLLPVQIDFLYRTGLSGSLVSIASFGVTAYAFARLVIAITGSATGALVSTVLLAANPNLLYLQATPMTEPLLLALVSMSVLWLYEWTATDAVRLPPRVGFMLFAAMWTRYEAWPILASACAASLYATWRRGGSWSTLRTRAISLASWPLAAVVIFLIDSRITVGSWFVTSGFYVPDPAYENQPLRTLIGIWWGTHQLSGYGVEIAGLAGAVVLIAWSAFRREAARVVMPVALFAAAALPFYAFYEGHPYRIRYMVPLVASCALTAGVLTGLTRRLAPLAAAALIAVAVFEAHPWDTNAPMLAEAQWDRPASRARRVVTACLANGYRGDKILASMGSLAHYMQELSWEGFDIADFIHEGNNAIWDVALETGPAPHAAWMLVEERAEGGDILAQRARSDPHFLNGMTRVCEGGGVALYKRDAPAVARRP